MSIGLDAVAFSRAHFGAGTGPIHLDNVGCRGNERNLTDCPHSSSIYCYRGHSEDAGVRCQGRSTGSCMWLEKGLTPTPLKEF